MKLGFFFHKYTYPESSKEPGSLTNDPVRRDLTNQKAYILKTSLRERFSPNKYIC